MAKKLLHRCIGAHARVCVYFLQRLCMHLNKCFDHHACAGVHVKQVLWHQCTHLRTCSLQGVHMRSCMCSLLIQRWGTRGASAYTFAYTLATGCAYALIYVQFVHSALGNESGGVQLVYEGTCCLAWGLMCDRRRDKGVVCLFSIFNAGGSVCGCMWVYTHTHTHTTHMEYSVVSPGVGMRHLEGPTNPDGLNLGI